MYLITRKSKFIIVVLICSISILTNCKTRILNRKKNNYSIQLLDIHSLKPVTDGSLVLNGKPIKESKEGIGKFIIKRRYLRNPNNCKNIYADGAIYYGYYCAKVDFSKKSDTLYLYKMQFGKKISVDSIYGCINKY
jgi:hypothetical protein